MKFGIGKKNYNSNFKLYLKLLLFSLQVLETSIFYTSSHFKNRNMDTK